MANRPRNRRSGERGRGWIVRREGRGVNERDDGVLSAIGRARAVAGRKPRLGRSLALPIADPAPLPHKRQDRTSAALSRGGRLLFSAERCPEVGGCGERRG